MDEEYMRRALALAMRGVGCVNPNPMVGCVVVKDGQVIGEGWHETYGGLHAERQALTHCTEDTEGATLYVTLEPCCHWGKTPPCTDAILTHKIARVVIGCMDPNPLVAGHGAALLRAHGVAVEGGILEDECRALNRIFLHYIQTKTPFVVLKYAMTLDGKLAAASGDSKWVTGEQARLHVHETRNRLAAIMVGIGTVQTDDPMLTCRIEGGRDPLRIICDSHLRISPDSRIVHTAREIPTLIAAIERNERAAALEAAGVELLLCAQRDGHVDLRDLMIKLGARGVDSVLLEGGAALHYAALEAGIVQSVQAYIAPKLIGGTGAKSPVGGIGIVRMADAIALKNTRLTHLGQDFLLEGEIACSPES